MTSFEIQVSTSSIQEAVQFLKEGQKQARHSIWAGRVSNVFFILFCLNDWLGLSKHCLVGSFTASILFLFATLAFQRWQIQAMLKATDLLVAPYKGIVFREVPNDR